MALYLLFEAASGYSLIQAYGIDDIGRNTEAIRNSVSDVNRFAELVQIVAFSPFDSPLDALNQYKAVSEGIMTEELRNFLELKLPKVKKGEKPEFSLGVSEPKVGSQIFEETKIPCQSDEFILELLHGVRFHYDKLVSDFELSSLNRFLGQSGSRATEKFDEYQVDNMVIEAIFELGNLGTRKSELSEDKIPGLTEILGNDEDKEKKIVEAEKASMGKDLSPCDLFNVENFSQRVMKLAGFRKNLHEFLVLKMNNIAPDVAFVIGEIVGARHTGRDDCFSETDFNVFRKKFHKQVEERLGFYDLDMMEESIYMNDGASEKNSRNETETKGDEASERNSSNETETKDDEASERNSSNETETKGDEVSERNSSNETETKGEVELIDENRPAAIETTGDASAEQDTGTEKKKKNKKRNNQKNKNKKKEEKGTSMCLPYTLTALLTFAFILLLFVFCVL